MRLTTKYIAIAKSIAATVGGPGFPPATSNHFLVLSSGRHEKKHPHHHPVCPHQKKPPETLMRLKNSGAS